MPRHQRPFAAGLCFFLLSLFPLKADPLPPVNEETKQDRSEHARRILDVAIYFAGEVNDQHGAAIEKAVVMAHVRHFSPVPPFFMAMKEVSVETDKKGFFEIKDVVGSDLLIHEVLKEGYEFHRGGHATTAFRYNALERNMHPE